jgi:hypothetical protein
MTVELRKKVFIHTTEEYNLNDEESAELRRLLAKIIGRRVTGEVVVNLAQGGVNAFRLREAVKTT